MTDSYGSLSSHSFGGVGGHNLAWFDKDDDYKKGLGSSAAASVAMGSMSSADAFQERYGANNIFDAEKARPEFT